MKKFLRNLEVPEVPLFVSIYILMAAMVCSLKSDPVPIAIVEGCLAGCLTYMLQLHLFLKRRSKITNQIAVFVSWCALFWLFQLVPYWYWGLGAYIVVVVITHLDFSFREVKSNNDKN